MRVRGGCVCGAPGKPEGRPSYASLESRVVRDSIEERSGIETSETCLLLRPDRVGLIGPRGEPEATELPLGVVGRVGGRLIWRGLVAAPFSLALGERARRAKSGG